MDGQHHLQHVKLAKILYNDGEKGISISEDSSLQRYLSVVPVVVFLPYD